MAKNSMRGWRRIGVVVSVIWFVGFGLFVWHAFVSDAVKPYSLALQTCGFILDSNNDALQYVPAEKRGAQQDANFQKYKKCEADALTNWERTRPDDRLMLPVVVGVDLASIGLGWLLVWFGVVIVRWIRRGFAPA